MKIEYPYLRKRKLGRGIRIEVMADSMRVGKTTAVQVIAEGLRKHGLTVRESYEDWQSNPHLKNSYADPAKNFLESQKWFVRRKWEQIRDGARLCRGSGEVNIFIQDVAPEMDYCYAVTNLRLGRMSEKNFTLYDQYYRSLDWEMAPAPDLLIYLSIGDSELIKRAESSKREFECVDDEYFLTMKKTNRKWLEGVGENREYRILNIETDLLDFAHDVGAKQDLVKQVSGLLDLV